MDFPIRPVLAALALSSLTASTAAAQTAGPPQRGGTMIMVLPEDPASVNPALSNSLLDMTIGCQVYQSLVDIDWEFKPKSVLAKSWTISPDALTYTFDLIETNWQDGKPFTSADVKYSLLEVTSKLKSSFQPAAKVIAGIDTPDPHKVVIRLKEPFGPFLMSLACEQGGAIMPKHLFEGTDPLKNPATLSTPVGTGPFSLADWKRGDRLRMVRNPKYWEPGKPYLDELIVKIITQPAARVQALQAGEVDLVQAIPINSLPVLKADPKLKIESSNLPPNVNWGFLNNRRKPLDDKRVRQAIMMATDRDYILKNAFFGIGEVGIAPISTDFGWLADPAVDYRKMYPFDPAKANALLDAAGLKRDADGKRFAMKIATYAGRYPEFVQVVAALRSMWRAVGIEVNSEQLESTIMVTKVFDELDFDFALMEFGTLGDPAIGIARVYTTAGIGKRFANPSGYSNPAVDALFDEGARATTLEERAVHYKKLQSILAEDLPSLNLRQQNQIDGASAKLQNAWGVARGEGRFGDAWLMK